MSTTAKFFLLWKGIKKSWRGAESMSFTTPTTQDTRTRFINPEVLSMMQYWPDVAKKADRHGNHSDVCPQLLPDSHCLGHRVWARWCWAWLSFTLSWDTTLLSAVGGASSITLHSLENLTDEYPAPCQQRMAQRLKFISHQWIARPSCQIANRYSIALCFA